MPSKHPKKRSHRHHRSQAPETGTLIFILLFLSVIGIQACIRAQRIAQTRSGQILPTLPLTSVAPTQTSTPTPVAVHTDFKEITHGDTSRKQVIFTFDAGSGTGSYEGIMAALAKHHVKGTFFLVGKWVEQNPALARRLVAEGHEVFNHSYDHPYFTQLSATEITEELQKMDDVLASTTGTHTRPYFRAPYGDRDAATIQAAADAGFQSIYWSVDSLDWREGETVTSVKNRVLPNIHQGAIVLMHVGDTPTGEVLDEIFTTLETQGYKLVSLTEGL